MRELAGGPVIFGLPEPKGPCGSKQILKETQDHFLHFQKKIIYVT